MDLTIALIEVIIRYGPRAAIEVIKGFDATNVTPEEIKALKVKPPEHYFGEKDGGT